MQKQSNTGYISISMPKPVAKQHIKSAICVLYKSERIFNDGPDHGFPWIMVDNCPYTSYMLVILEPLLQLVSTVVTGPGTIACLTI